MEGAEARVAAQSSNARDDPTRKTHPAPNDRSAEVETHMRAHTHTHTHTHTHPPSNKHNTPSGKMLRILYWPVWPQSKNAQGAPS